MPRLLLRYDLRRGTIHVLLHAAIAHQTILSESHLTLQLRYVWHGNNAMLWIINDNIEFNPEMNRPRHYRKQILPHYSDNARQPLPFCWKNLRRPHNKTSKSVGSSHRAFWAKYV